MQLAKYRRPARILQLVQGFKKWDKTTYGHFTFEFMDPSSSSGDQLKLEEAGGETMLFQVSGWCLFNFLRWVVPFLFLNVDGAFFNFCGRHAFTTSSTKFRPFDKCALKSIFPSAYNIC